MKRLTARSEDGDAYYPYCVEGDKCFGMGASEKCDTCGFNDKVCERLAAYEDTGLTPKQIRKMKKEMEGKDE